MQNRILVAFAAATLCATAHAQVTAHLDVLHKRQRHGLGKRRPARVPPFRSPSPGAAVAARFSCVLAFRGCPLRYAPPPLAAVAADALEHSSSLMRHAKSLKSVTCGNSPHCAVKLVRMALGAG